MNTLMKKNKAELENQLNAILDSERKEKEKNLAILLKTLKPEIDAYKSLVSFHKRGKVMVELNYDIEMTFDMYDLGYNPDSKSDPDLDLGEVDGSCSIGPIKEPKGYKVTQFVAEDAFANMGLDAYDEIEKIHPEVKKHCDAFLKAKRNLAKKVAKLADKMGIEKEEAFNAVIVSLG